MRHPLRTFTLLLLTGSTAVFAGMKFPAVPPEQAGESLAQLIVDRDSEGLANRIDMKTLLNSVMQGTDLSDKDRADIDAGFQSSRTRLANGLIKSIAAQHAQVKLVRSRTTPKGSVQIIRLNYYDDAGQPSGYEYLEFELGRDGRIVDWYGHAQGSSVTDNMRMLISGILDTSSLQATVFGRAEVNEDAMAALKAYTAAINKADFAGAYAALARMPSEFRGTRQWATLQASAAASLGDTQYRAALDHLAQAHGNDPDAQFMLIDHYYFRKEHTRMIESIQNFENRVVSDGVTNMLECTGLLLDEQIAAAERVCLEATEIEPEFVNAWWTLVDVRAKSRDAVIVLGTLDEIERRFELKMNPDLLLQQPGYEWLAEAEGFDDWAEARR
ncbi:MAG: hypothetical protein IPK97_15510 [Ahniella sp.]|nr:hypothetical protein [Ahniella sp.]